VLKTFLILITVLKTFLILITVLKTFLILITVLKTFLILILYFIIIPFHYCLYFIWSPVKFQSPITTINK